MTITSLLKDIERAHKKASKIKNEESQGNRALPPVLNSRIMPFYQSGSDWKLVDNAPSSNHPERLFYSFCRIAENWLNKPGGNGVLLASVTMAKQYGVRSFEDYLDFIEAHLQLFSHVDTVVFPVVYPTGNPCYVDQEYALVPFDRDSWLMFSNKPLTNELAESNWEHYMENVVEPADGNLTCSPSGAKLIFRVSDKCPGVAEAIKKARKAYTGALENCKELEQKIVHAHRVKCVAKETLALESEVSKIQSSIKEGGRKLAYGTDNRLKTLEKNMRLENSLKVARKNLEEHLQQNQCFLTADLALSDLKLRFARSKRSVARLEKVLEDLTILASKSDNSS